MRKGTILVVTALDERTVLLKSLGGALSARGVVQGARAPSTRLRGQPPDRSVLTSARRGPTMVRPGSCECTAALYESRGR